MGCTMEFTGEQLQFRGSTQKIMIDILLQHGELDINELALNLDVTIARINGICDSNDFLFDQQAENLARIFLRFLGRTFFQEISIIRNFVPGRF